MRERIEILQAQQQEECHLINSNNEIFGVCRHKTKFHRFLKENEAGKSTCISTYEGIKPERVNDNRRDYSGDLERSPWPVHICDIIPPPGVMSVANCLCMI